MITQLHIAGVQQRVVSITHEAVTDDDIFISRDHSAVDYETLNAYNIYENVTLYTRRVIKKREENNRCPVRYRFAGRIKDIKIVKRAARVNNKSHCALIEAR